MIKATSAASWRRQARRFLGDVRGAMAVEFAILVPLIIVVTAALFEFVWLMYDYQAATDSTREGVRAALIGDTLADLANLETQDIVCTFSGGSTSCSGGATASTVIEAGDVLVVAMTEFPAHRLEVDRLDHGDLLARVEETVRFWESWSALSEYEGPYRDVVVRSALAIKGLTDAKTEAVVAAPTTSLPEEIGGERNWDYRYCWIRDSVALLYALGRLGYRYEVHAFGEWIGRTTAARPEQLQIMYGIGGERLLTETELTHLSGYRNSAPVRIGNGAYSQFQLDIYGEIMDSAHIFRKFGGSVDPEYWEYLRRVVTFVIDHWREPDEGIWETRSGRQHFVFSKVMCWVAMDRAIKAATDLGLPGDVESWRKVREEIRAEIMEKGFSTERQAFVQSYGSTNLDAANLMLPLVGFIPATDPKMRATIKAIQAELTSPQGFVYRYTDFDDGLGGTEGSFTICTFWLADNLIQLGEVDEARKLFDAAMGCANDLGLLSEEFDANTGAMLGNFPQAFSHMAVINTAVQLQRADNRSAPAPDRT